MTHNLKNETYLIITASGGSGILLAAKAQAQRLKKQNPNARIIVKDLMLQWLGGFLGNFGVSAWNSAQKKGKVRYQEFLVSMQRLADIIFWPQIFFYTFRTLIKEDVDYVFDAQPLGTKAIIKAIRLFNRISKKKLCLRKIIVDLPSKKSTHFYNSIKRLSKKDKGYIFISTIKPLLEKNQTDEEFWRKYCKLSLDKVCYNSYPIRLGFDAFENKKHEFVDYFVNIETQKNLEQILINNVVKEGRIEAKKDGLNFNFKIKSDDFLITILLGSQPAFNGTLNYVQNLINFLKNNKHIKRNILVFSYCSSFDEGLIKKMHDLVISTKDYPKNLTVIPMSFQKEDIIAFLFFRSNITVTRSGGQTAVELSRVSNAKICVHSEFRGNKVCEKKLLKGIPAWESGSASYMKEIMNATIVNPDIFINVFSDLMIN
jgi:hypothetical protein